MAEKSISSLNDLYEQFLDDLEVKDEDIAKHGFKHFRVYQKWVKFKFDLEEKLDNALEFQKKLYEKIKTEYLNKERTASIGYVITQHNVKDIIEYDTDYIDYKKKIKEVEKMLEYVLDYVLPYLRSETYVLKNINDFLRG